MCPSFSKAFTIIIVCSFTNAWPILNSHLVKRVQEGQPIHLSCKVEGSSPPVARWLHNGKHIPQSPHDLLAESTEAVIIDGGKDYQSETDSRLYIAHATKRHSGKYTCVAETEQKKVSKSYTVEVVKPLHSSDKQATKPDSELRITQYTSSAMQTEGRPVYLICRATQGISKSVPTIKWTLGDTLLEDDPEKGIKIHNNGDLEISKATIDFHWNNNDLYCHAYGEDNKFVSENPWVYIMPGDDK